METVAATSKHLMTSVTWLTLIAFQLRLQIPICWLIPICYVSHMASPLDPVGISCGDNSLKDPPSSVTFYREKDN